MSETPEGTAHENEPPATPPSQLVGEDYWKAEAKKAFAERDQAKKKAKDLEGKVFDDDTRAEYYALKAAADKAEETRAKKAGEFETLKQQLTDKHGKEIKDRDAKISNLSERFKRTVIRAEFGAATDYFSGAESSKTIFDVDMAIGYLGKFVSVEDVEDDPDGFRVVVKNPKGNTILGADGNPAPFAQAIGELIAALPNKDRILRGSGRTGSGSSGGSKQGGSAPVDTGRLTPGDFADPKVREQVRREQAAAGGLQMGRYWDTQTRR